MKIVIFSDIHYLDRKYEGSGNRKLIEKSIPILNCLIDKINNEIKPDICINLGDLIQDTNNHDEDIRNIKFIWNKLNEIHVPFYTLIGNHDLKMMKSRREIEEVIGYKNATFSVDINGYHLVFLSTETNNKYGVENGGIYKTQYVSDDDLKWLDKDLQNNKLPTVIFNHFGIAEDDLAGNFWFERNPESGLLKNRDKVKEIIKRYNNIICVFSGHQHWSKKIIENNIPYYIVGSLIENIKEDGIPDGVYFIVELDGRKINVIEKHIKL